MRGVNKVILVGTLGKDPETKTFANGGSLCRIRLLSAIRGQIKVPVNVKNKRNGTVSCCITV